jgi:D-ribulokinase
VSVHLGIDLGTQSVRVLAVSPEGAVLASSSQKLTSRREGVRHEQDPHSWWTATAVCLREVMAVLGGAVEVKGIAVDATSGTMLLVDEQGRPLTAALMYDDGRARDEAAEANERGGDLWRQMSYRMQPSWALPKLMWLMRNEDVPARARLAHQNDFVNAKLAGRATGTDSSHALKTGYDLIRGEWPEAVMESLRVPMTLLPEVVKPGTRIGEVGSEAAQQTGVPAGVPIYAGMTDGCAAQIASGATEAGSWNTVIGTTLVVKGATRELLHDPQGVVYSHRSADGLWLPGGASSTGAAAIAAEFAASDLERLNHAAEHAAPTDLVVYPLVSKGERFPFAAPDAVSFTLGEAVSVEQRYVGVLQGIAMIERLSFDVLRGLGASTDGRFTISGGAVKSDALNRMRADILERDLMVPEVTEGAFGMAMLAAASESSMQEVTARMVRIARTIRPKRDFSEYAEQYAALRAELENRGWLAPITSMAEAHA